MVNHRLDLLDRTFAALADSTRRGIVATLATGPRTVGAIATPLPMSLVAVSKHIGVLERAGLVTRTRVGRTQVCRLRPDALREAAGWLDTYRAFWTVQIDSLEDHLSSTATNSTATRTRPPRTRPPPEGAIVTSLEITRTLPAAPERVWHAFTDPAALTAWFWPHLAAVVEVDLRVGGGFRITATNGPAEDFGISGEYVTLEPPHRLVFTWRWHGEPDETLVTIELAAAGDPGKTVMTLVHERFGDPASRDAHAQGWHDCLDRLPPWLAS